MKLKFKHNCATTAVLIALSLTGCSRFETRMESNGSYNYQDAELVEPYKTGEFSNHEARNSYEIPELTEQQKVIGLTTDDVDVRPPTQFIAVLDGVLLESTKDGRTKIWFNAFNQSEDMEEKVWSLLKSYLADNNVEIVNENVTDKTIETGVFVDKTSFGSTFSSNVYLRETRYQLSLVTAPDAHSVGLIVDALSFEETNDGQAQKINLVARKKTDVETHFINDIQEYAYNRKESEQLADLDNQPLSIKLGFDDNHQSAWIVDSDFLTTWLKLPTLLNLLSFEIIEDDKNLGYFLLKFKQPNDEYWAENNLNKFELENAEYFIQLGEVTGGTTSISWLDEDKKPLPDKKVTEIYLSITDKIRGVLLERDKQTKEF